MKKFLSCAAALLLSAAILSANVPAFAVTAGTPVISTTVPAFESDDSIYLGMYVENTPLKWYVLDAKASNSGDTNGMYLLATTSLGFRLKFNLESYNYNGVDIKGMYWDKSWLQSWVESTLTDSNGAVLGLYAKGFSSPEQDAMLSTTLNEENLPYDDNIGFFQGQSLANEKIFLPSYYELFKKYTDANGNPLSWAIKADQPYWLRSAFHYQSDPLPSEGVFISAYPILLTADGYFNDASEVGGYPSTPVPAYISKGVRPAFNLDKRKVVLYSDAAQTDKGGVTGSVRSITSKANVKEWKTTLLNSGLTLTLGKAVRQGNRLEFQYSGASTGGNVYLSAICTDSTGKALYYGRLANLTSASGSINTTLPGNFDSANLTFKVFVEQGNAGTASDYASAPQTVSYTSASCSLAVPSPANGTVTATYANPFAGFPNEADTLTATGGQTAVFTGGTSMALSFTGNEGYEFSSAEYKLNFTGVEYGIAGPITYTPYTFTPFGAGSSGTVTLSADFTEKRTDGYKLLFLSAPDGGVMTATYGADHTPMVIGTTGVPENTSVTLTIVPDEHHEVVYGLSSGGMGDLISHAVSGYSYSVGVRVSPNAITSPTTTFTMPKADVEVFPVFRHKTEYYLSGDASFDAGAQTVTVNAAANNYLAASASTKLYAAVYRGGKLINFDSFDVGAVSSGAASPHSFTLSYADEETTTGTVTVKVFALDANGAPLCGALSFTQAN